jgi:hypothetical protein
VVLMSAVGLLLLAVGAHWRSAWKRFHRVATLWTAVALLLRLYVLLVQRAERFSDVVPALQVLVLLVVLAIALRTLPLVWRLLGATVVIGGLLASIAVALAGGAVAVAGIAQAVVLSIAVLWEVLTSGRRVTNRDGRHWPRDARVVGFLGYSLVDLSVALFINTTDGLAAAGITVKPGDFPAVGLVLLGFPLTVYALH